MGAIGTLPPSDPIVREGAKNSSEIQVRDTVVPIAFSPTAVRDLTPPPDGNTSAIRPSALDTSQRDNLDGDSSPEVIRLAVMMYIRYPLSLRQVEDLLFERGIDICHETVRYWWNRFAPMFAAEIRKRRIYHRSYSQWRWHLDEVFVRINGQTHYLWRAVDHEGEVLEVLRRSAGIAGPR